MNYKKLQEKIAKARARQKIIKDEIFVILEKMKTNHDSGLGVNFNILHEELMSTTDEIIRLSELQVEILEANDHD